MSYKVQIDDDIRDATPDEINQIETAQQTAQHLADAIVQATNAKSSARAKLKALGLTEAEIVALVG